MKKLFVFLILLTSCGHNIKREYYPNGKIKSEIPYSNNQIDGVVKYYNDSGKLKSTMLFVSGRKNGHQIECFKDGWKDDSFWNNNELVYRLLRDSLGDTNHFRSYKYGKITKEIMINDKKNSDENYVKLKVNPQLIEAKKGQQINLKIDILGFNSKCKELCVFEAAVVKAQSEMELPFENMPIVPIKDDRVELNFTPKDTGKYFYVLRFHQFCPKGNTLLFVQNGSFICR